MNSTATAISPLTDGHRLMVLPFPPRAVHQYAAHDDRNNADDGRDETLLFRAHSEGTDLHGLTIFRVADPAKRENYRACNDQDCADNAKWSHT